MLKKILGVILITVLLLGTVAFADDEENVNQAIDEMQVLQDIGIIEGDPSGDLRPDDELTRAEFATILCRAMGMEELAKSTEMSEKNYFSDVSGTYWAAGYINTAVESKAINGFEDGTFRPELTVTNEQVVKMLVAAWGYSDEAEKLGGYPNGYMEIATRYGVTDTVLFNYGVASKRWVACAFTYGALAMPLNENIDIEIPVKTEPQINIEPRPENTKYIDDAVSILKRVTPESAKYERTVIEQKVSCDFIPFDFQDGILLFNEETSDRRITAYVPAPEGKQPLAEGYFSENRFDMSNLPIGEWNCQLSIVDGAVRDTFFVPFRHKGDNLLEFTGNATRYTTLNAQPILNEVGEELTCKELQDSKLNPFILTPTFDEDGNPAISIAYPFVIEKDYQFVLNMNTTDAQIVEVADTLIHGKDSVIDTIIVNGLELDTDYHIQVSVRSKYGDDVALKGIIQLIESDGTIGYLFEGRVRTLIIDGYKISDYE